MTRICFVCRGNICRSPACEAMLRQKASHCYRPELHIESRGINGQHNGEAPDPKMVAAALVKGYSVSGISKELTLRDLENFDTFVALDHHVFGKLSKYTQGPSIIWMRNVLDPYGGRRGDYELAVRQCESLCDEIWEFLC